MLAACVSFCAGALTACAEENGLYAACDVPEDCEPPEDKQAACVAKDSGGFCSWTCGGDADCDIDDDIEYACASFESTSGMYCFPSCEVDDVCPEDFECRSTGGGSNNRKICFPL